LRKKREAKRREGKSSKQKQKREDPKDKRDWKEKIRFSCLGREKDIKAGRRNRKRGGGKVHLVGDASKN